LIAAFDLSLALGQLVAWTGGGLVAGAIACALSLIYGRR
jgi:hypothetical protein